MKRIIIIMTTALLWCASANAQNIRLGEKIPEISVESILGEQLRLIEQEYTCLIFMHSKCEPCATALPQFHKIASPISERLAVVLLTNESSDMEEELNQRFGSYVTSIAFDRNKHTYRAFGINFVPFGVIYHTKNRRIEWFGSIQQLDNAQLNAICKTQK
ncbi:MAG: thioredoxin family protein [Alistipes sp.]|nr:thioredoxin family protein [Alistipes sp.]